MLGIGGSRGPSLNPVLAQPPWAEAHRPLPREEFIFKENYLWLRRFVVESGLEVVPNMASRALPLALEHTSKHV